MSAAPDPAPAALVQALAACGLARRDVQEQVPSARRRPVRRFLGGGVVVDVATSPHGRQLNLLEVRGRSWARAAGLPTVRVLGADERSGDWLVGELVATAPASGPAYLDHALAVAARLSRQDAPVGGPGRTSWRAARRTRPARLARMLTAGVPLRQFQQVRAAAAGLPQVAVAHGDLTYRNLLHVEGADAVTLVDWEYLGPAPAHVDELRLWSTLKAPADRAHLMDGLLRGLPRREHPGVGLLALWLCLRLFAENVAAPAQDRDLADAAHARGMAREAAHLARELQGWPR